MQFDIASVPPRSEDMLDFVIVGGGLTGLATAWSLQRVGHRITLFEQQDNHVMSQCRESFRCPPSMTQILNDWGIGDKLSKISTSIDQITFLDGSTGNVLGLIAIDKVRETLPADFALAQYGEMFTMFYDLSKQAGVHLHYITKVVSIDPWNTSVTCEDGRQWTANIIVGADGLHSIARPVVLDLYVPESDRESQLTVNLIVPSDVLEQDEALAPFLHTKNCPVWLGDNCFVAGAVTGPGPNHDYSLTVLITLYGEDSWAELPSSLEGVNADLFEPRVRKLLKHSEKLSSFVFTHHAPFDNWVHESGKVVLIGDAAHPIPSSLYNIFMEDAMTLSVLFSLPASKSHTPMLLNAYEELRQPRCAAVQRYVRRKREIILMPHGLGQRKRDEVLRSQRVCYRGDEADDEFLCNTYTGFLQVFSFDAREAVEGWWVKWGRGILVQPSISKPGPRGGDDSLTGTLVPTIVDAEVEREEPGYPIISDPLMGEDEDVIREVEARGRG